MANTKEIYLTEEGLNEIKEELRDLKEVQRPAVITALKEARSLGDLSENAEYDAAKSAQAEVEGKIKQLEVMIENAIVIKEVGTDVVSVGNTVKIEYLEDNEIAEYTIVGTKEADPFENKISNESPIAKAIMGHEVGDTVTVICDAGNYDVKIMEIL